MTQIHCEGSRPIKVTLFTAAPRGIIWQLKILEDGWPRYEGRYSSRWEALAVAEARAARSGGVFAR